MRNIFVFVLMFFALCLVALIATDVYVSTQAASRIYQDVDAIPHRPVAVVLGTSKYIGKQINLFYPPRLAAAQKIFEKHKVGAIIVSGDNATRYYNEPQTMMNDLTKAGIPHQYVVRDYAGFRTLDSMVRAKEIFGQQSFTIVSQAFHCERAIYIAKQYDIDALCYAADDPPGLGGLKVRLREVLARAKAVLDITLLNKQPKFLGPKEQVVLRVD